MMHYVILVEPPGHEQEIPLVTNIGAANGTYWTGFFAAIMLVVFLVDKFWPIIARVVKARRDRRENGDDYHTPADQLRTHPGGKTIKEIERDTELRKDVETIKRDLGGAFKKIEALLEWKTLMMQAIGKMPEEGDIQQLSEKIDDLRTHIDRLDDNYRQRLDDHIRDYHRPPPAGS